MSYAQQLKVAAARKRLDAAEAACKAKAVYTTRAEASTFLRRRNFKSTIYSCQFCGYFHVSSLNKREFKRVELEIRQARKFLEESTVPSN